MRVSIIGLGRAGATMHLPALRRIQGVDVVAGFDFPDAGERPPGLTIVPTIDDAIDVADAVIIATPPETLTGLACRVLEANRHCYVEKPMATTRADAERVIASVDRSERTCQVGFAYRHHPTWQRIKRAIEDGRLRTPLTMTGSFGSNKHAPVPQADVGIHHVDMTLWLTGAAVSDTEVGADGRLRLSMDDGSVLDGMYTRGSGHDRVVIEDAGGARVAFTRLPRYKLEISGVRLPMPGRRDAGVLRARRSPGWERSFEYALTEFVRACRAGRAAWPSPRDVVASTAAAEQIIAAARAGEAPGTSR